MWINLRSSRLHSEPIAVFSLVIDLLTFFTPNILLIRKIIILLFYSHKFEPRINCKTKAEKGVFILFYLKLNLKIIGEKLLIVEAQGA